MNVTLSFKWKVAEAPSGPYKSFHKRGWPGAWYSNGKIAGQIYCDDGYYPVRARSGEHCELTVRVADYSVTPWKWRTMTVRPPTLEMAKQQFARFIKKHPEFAPKD